MFCGLTVGVVIPAHNEAEHIDATLSGIPDWVDRVIVVDDASQDTTATRVKEHPDLRVLLLRHRSNLGVGGAILTGYREVLRLGLDVAVVMGGDGQMDPADLPALLEPLCTDKADYAKGNRFAHPAIWRTMPAMRLVGNAALSLLTRRASGFPEIIDSQSGYTAASAGLLQRINFASVYPRYGFPNDFLAHVHSSGGRVAQVPVRPIYAGENSGIRPLYAVLPLSWVLLRAWVLRKWREQLHSTSTIGSSPDYRHPSLSPDDVEATGNRR
mgnify:CR=1 FL=1